MSKIMKHEFALQEPALAIAPVFLVLHRAPGGRPKLDVTQTFGGAKVRWQGDEALGIAEQSVLLALLSIAAQQNFLLNRVNPSTRGKLLLPQLALSDSTARAEFKVLVANWTEIATAAGYSNIGGQTRKLVKESLNRLAATTASEEAGGKHYQSHLLGWIEGDDGNIWIVLNARATNALCGGQHSVISIDERHQLNMDAARALHAWLSALLKSGTTKKFHRDGLHKHIWAGNANGSTLRTRRQRLRDALAEIDQLGQWACENLSNGCVEISRSNGRSPTPT